MPIRWSETGWSRSRYECELIDDMKDNPNLFHGYCRRSLKAKQGVSNVVDGSGRLTETKGEAAAAPNTYYHLVFTRDDGSSPLLVAVAVEYARVVPRQLWVTSDPLP